jgi:hypothetical protein
MQEKSALQFVRNVMSGKSLAAMLIVTRPMRTHMAVRRTDKRTITVITTTWTIRWWNGEMWVEHTLGPRVTIVVGSEETSSPDKLVCDGAPVSQEPSDVSESAQRHKHHKESTP